MISTIAVRNQN